MTKSAVALACLLSFLIPAIASAQPTTKKRIEAGAVEMADGAMTATFRVTESSGGITSPGTGGACLVFSERRRGDTAGSQPEARLVARTRVPQPSPGCLRRP